MALGPGTILKGKYRVVDRLGSGGMGMVWQGRDLDLNRDVAIKVMLNADDDLESFKRFQREAQVAARLQHSGLTVVHDFGRDHDQFFIVMELLKGADLKALLREHPAGLPAGRVMKLALLAAEALSAAHENGVVHRDIKPANLFVLPDDRIKICDFGIAKLADAT
ncbi:MAG TPA: serine/threonine-protein kinase, partial [Streptosporangiaceae bacterium]|nr:serine/threonine-protein kinase [Streptosporangiaceae bacterium]